MKVYTIEQYDFACELDSEALWYFINPREYLFASRTAALYVLEELYIEEIKRYETILSDRPLLLEVAKSLDVDLLFKVVELEVR